MQGLPVQLAPPSAVSIEVVFKPQRERENELMDVCACIRGAVDVDDTNFCLLATVDMQCPTDIPIYSTPEESKSFSTLSAKTWKLNCFLD